MRRLLFSGTLILLAVMSLTLEGSPSTNGKPWTRHVIDDASRGADGARLMDINGDGLPDVITGWEER